VLTSQNKAELFAQTEGKSKREVEKVLANYLPERAAPTKLERIRVSSVKEDAAPLFQSPPSAVAKKTFTITLELTEDEMNLVEEARKVLCTSKVKDALLGSAKKLIQRKLALDSKRKRRAEAKSLPPVAINDTRKQSEISSRYIPADVRHTVEQRDKCRCSFVATDDLRCSETRNLQFDHIIPHALGGKSSVENLRLLCPAHNQLEAEKVFGEAVIRRLVQFKQEERLAESVG
jgi:5-methylcytosine-specific restriction endonuclease McrA